MALIGLICIGLMGLGGVLFFAQTRRAQELAIAGTAAVPPTSIPPTVTPTSTTTPTPTNTPEPTPTSTSVIDGEVAQAGEGVEAPPVTEPDGAEQDEAVQDGMLEITSTSTLVVQTPTATAAAAAAVTSPPSVAIPSSGGVLAGPDNEWLFWIAGSMILILLAYGSFYRYRALVQKE